VQRLRKRYGELRGGARHRHHRARGEVFGLLGPNGAGKTTTVEILEGYRSARRRGLGARPRPGRRSIELRRRIGIVLQSGGIYSHVTPREALRHWAASTRTRATSRRSSSWPA
jgi:ABC-2 type transport system ATP-binding protein